MQENDIISINNFNEKCIDFMSGKYILADIKVRAILRAINDSDVLTNLVSRCVNNYDFNEGFRKATSDELGEATSLTLPEKPRERVALIYHILRSIDEEVISFYDFVSRYISHSNQVGNEEFKAFADGIVQPFNEAINTLLQTEYSDRDLSSTNRYMRNMEKALADINAHLDEYRLNPVDLKELKCLLEALSVSLGRNDDLLVNALVIGIDNFCASHHRAKQIIKYLQASQEE